LAQFQYQGVDRAGKKINGSIDALNEGEVRMALRTQGVRPTSISKAGGVAAAVKSVNRSSNKGLNLAQILGFTRQLQVLISSGVPVVQSLEILEEQASEKSTKSVFGALKEKISGGMFMWEALAQFPKAFPKIYIALVRAGESSGSIDQMLGRLGKYLENTERMRRMVKSAMMYPLIVSCIGVGVVGLMMVFVIPKFEEILASANQALPLPTQVVVTISHFIIKNIALIIAGVVTAVYLTIRFAKTREGKAFFDRLAFKLPLFGGLVQKSGTARFTRTMGTLLASGVNLIEAIDICRTTIDNVVLEDAVGKIRAEVEGGKTLGLVLGRLKVFPRMAVQMISVGEATGALDKMLEKVADFYEEEVEITVAGMSKLIEPLVLVILGGTVGGIMIAMYLPIFQVAGAAAGGN
jgi:type IV pilus assembly protein PilC